MILGERPRQGGVLVGDDDGGAGSGVILPLDRQQPAGVQEHITPQLPGGQCFQARGGLRANDALRFARGRRRAAQGAAPQQSDQWNDRDANAGGKTARDAHTGEIHKISSLPAHGKAGTARQHRSARARDPSESQSANRKLSVSAGAGWPSFPCLPPRRSWFRRWDRL